MAWVEMYKDYDWRVGDQATVALIAGMRVPVTHECLAAVVEAGAGVEIPTPPRAASETADATVSAARPVGLDPALAWPDRPGAAK